MKKVKFYKKIYFGRKICFFMIKVLKKKDLIYTFQFIKKKKKNTVLTGIGMRSNSKLTLYTINKVFFYYFISKSKIIGK